jgi:hypothetical protein
MEEKKIKSLLLKLADADVRQIYVGYEGGGDSGFIEEIFVRKDVLGDDEIEYHDDFLNNGWKNMKDFFDHEMVTELEQFCYNHILDVIEDWVNNDGGYGFLLINVPSGKVYNENNVRYYQTEKFYNNLNLIEVSETKTF